MNWGQFKILNNEKKTENDCSVIYVATKDNENRRNDCKLIKMVTSQYVHPNR